VTEPARDEETVTVEGQLLQQVPHGVTFRDATTHVDERGSLCEMFDERWEWHRDPLVYAYFVTVRPGIVKGWAMHLEHEDRYLIVSGELEVVMYDDREDSPTRGLLSKVYLTEHRRRLMNIPVGVWHADHNVGRGDVLLVNFPTLPYDYTRPDKYRLPLDTDRIPHSFEGAHGW